VTGVGSRPGRGSGPVGVTPAYSLKETADYAVGYEARVSVAEAEQAIEICCRFVETISRLLTNEGAP
jgi:hypothetical protein